MDVHEAVYILKTLLEGVEELNGEYQEGWDDEISRGNLLLEHLQNIEIKYPNTILEDIIALNDFLK